MIRFVLLSVFSLGSTALAGEKVIAKLQVPVEEGKPVDVVVSRTGSADGGVMVTLKAKSGTAKAQTLVVYQGGGDEDGAGDKDVRGVSAAPFDLPGGKKGLRVDVTYHAPDKPKKEDQTDTTLVALDGKPRPLVELTTRVGRDRSKVCRENQEVALALEGDDLAATTSTKLEAALGDDDLPVDPKCKSPAGGYKKIYKWSDGKFVDPSAQPAKPKEPESDD
jgi:hypothetical protein